MKKLHAKSLCCRASVWHFGGHRRQCAGCKRTWRIRKKKRGRKIKREHWAFCLKYFQHEIPSLASLARIRGKSERSVQARLRRSLENYFRNTPWPSLPTRTPLVLIADAMVRSIGRHWYTIYIMAVKRPEDSFATLAPPVLLKGTESIAGWQVAFNTLHPEVLKNVVALVCDGHRGLIYYARRKLWHIQRCHFHLVARIQGRRSRWSKSRHQEEGERIYALVHQVLTTKDETIILSLLTEIEEIGWLNTSPGIRRALAGFVNNYEDFRTYLKFPELNLPRTSNSIESFIGTFNYVCHRARGFSTVHAFLIWLGAFVKYKQRIKCNGFSQPNYGG